MQILLFTFITIFSLSLLTYAHLESYFNLSLLHFEKEGRRLSLEEEYCRKRQIAKLHSISKSGPSKKEALQSISKLNLFFLFATSSYSNEEEKRNFTSVFLKLLSELYERAHFLSPQEEGNISLLERLILALERAVKNPSCGQILRSPKELANLDLMDHDLNELWYKMIKGVDEPQEQLTFPSLLDEVTYHPRPTMLNLYLASPHLLRAVYRSDATVELLIQRRTELKRQLKQKFVSAEEAQKELSNLFLLAELTLLPLPLLHFHIQQR